MSSPRRIRRTAQRTTTVLGVAGGLAGLTLAGPAAAAATAGAPEVVNRETVQAQLDATGKVESARVYNQLTVLGKGQVSVQDPTSGTGLRDLDGFSAPVVRDGKAQYAISVDGREDRRTVADYEQKLPITVKAEYRLNGEEVAPEDVVGKSGTLEVTYTVVNRTAEPTEITYLDGNGKEVKETVDLVTPYVGSLGVVLPRQFSEVSAEFADVAGDGRGGTGLKWSLVLFDPLGAPAQQLTWSAQIEDAELPPATLQAVPVAPGGNQVLANSETSIAEGATAASALTAGATKIDGKVLELRDGARKILDGVSQLAAGATTLSDGLSKTAAPGARQLADGLVAAKAGSDKLTGGLGQLDAGAGQVSAGLSELNAKAQALGPGSAELAKGGADLAAGIAKIKDGVDSLPVSMQQNAGFLQLKGTLDRVQAGIGSYEDVATPTTANPTLLGALNALKYGMRNPAKLSAADCDTEPGKPTSCGVADVNERVSTALQAAGSSSNAGLEGLISAAKKAYADASCPPAPSGAPVPIAGYLPASAIPSSLAACQGISTLLYGLALPANVPGTGQPAGGVLAQTQTSKKQLLEAAAGLKKAYEGIDASVIPTLTKVQGGLSNPGWDVNANGMVDDGEKPGVKEVQALVSAGLDALVTGISTNLSGFLGTAAAGSQKLAAGQAMVAASAPALLDGIGRLDAGAKKLAEGTGAAADGGGSLSDGLLKLRDGGGKLADGLQTAADGSGKIADGLGKVEAGQTQLADGANRLSGEGTSLLARSAGVAAASNAKKAAMLQAMGEKAADGALPFGLPEGATGTAAYSFTLAGANTQAEDSTTRGAAALALLALGSLSGFAVRRRSGA
jgi:putative membrane protein